MRTTWTVAALALVAACTTQQGSKTQQAVGTEQAAGSIADSTAAAGTAVSDTGTRPDTGAMPGMPGMPGMVADTGAAGGVPAGYVGRTDRDTIPISRVSYTPVQGGRWEVRAGPAHIVYAPRDTASGQYTVETTFDQQAKPRFPEGYGIFVGGSALDEPTQRYTYVLVRGTGEYLVKMRTGDTTRTIAPWTASPAIPKTSAAGVGSYRLQVQVGADSVRVSVNGRPVTSVAKSAVDTDGIVGLRINHGLRVVVSPPTITR